MDIITDIMVFLEGIFNWIIELVTGIINFFINDMNLTDAIIVGLVGAVIIITMLIMGAIIVVFVFRRLGGRINSRYGCNRVGPQGVLQLIADFLKLWTKEDVVPSKSDRWLFFFVPSFALGPGLVVSDLDVGILFIEGISACSILAVFVAGYAPNNKYALISAFRNIAQIISYEIPMILTIVSVVVLAGTLSTVGIVEAQSGLWYVFAHPLAFFVFFVALLSEMAVTPFDMREAEDEILGGWGVEYSGMRYGFIYFAEFIHWIVGSMLVVTLFFGGWHGPVILGHEVLSGFLWFLVKTCAFVAIIIWIKWSLPRYRVDQLTAIGWKILLPLSFLSLLWAAVLKLGVL
jgi:NADH-quinone oxidoreductase subunit H